MVEKHKFFFGQSQFPTSKHRHTFISFAQIFFYLYLVKFLISPLVHYIDFFQKAANIKWSTLKVEIINTKKIMMQNISKVNKQKNLKRDVFFLPHQQQHSMCVHIENTTYST